LFFYSSVPTEAVTIQQFLTALHSSLCRVMDTTVELFGNKQCFYQNSAQYQKL